MKSRQSIAHEADLKALMSNKDKPLKEEEGFTLHNILHEIPNKNKRTKIICTMGPACWDVDTIVKLIDAGMNVARLNFSHGDHEGHGATVQRLREAMKQRPKNPVGILLDTKGPEIRTGFFRDGKKSITLTKGQDLEITTDYDFKGDETKFACSYEELTKSVKVGGQILIADGSLVCKVKEIKDKSVIVEVSNNATIGERKNMNLPGGQVKLPTITEKDETDIVDFGLKHNVDFIALSFARFGDDIDECREILGPRGAHIKIIAKIENQEGLNNYHEILDRVDGIMVARGDLGMEIPTEKVFLAQKWMTRLANEKGKPLIIATQMMESMVNNPRPTRAEASDVANAVLDGADCVMLSGETANGSFPVQCVQTMNNIALEAENCFENEIKFWNSMKKTMKYRFTSLESLCSSAVQMSFEMALPVIIVFTQGGTAARLISKYRPKAHIVAVSDQPSTVKGLCVSSGVNCLRVPTIQDGQDQLVVYAIEEGKKLGLCASGNNAVCLLSDDKGHDILTIKRIP